jgi:hypothetical protein
MDRFQKLALGITNANLERIAVGKTQIKAPTNKTMETHVVNLNINIDNVKVSGEVSETTTCKEKHCFEKEFKACNAGQINRLNYLELPVEREYTIVGPSGDNCVITVDYIKDLNPKYEGLKARCTYNTSLSFHNAMQHADNKTMSAYSEALSKNQNLKNVQTDCSGSYWDIMMNIK